MQGFFIYRMFYVFTTILAYLKFMNEMRSPVNRPKKKNQLSVYPNPQAIVEKLANSGNPTAPI